MEAKRGRWEGSGGKQRTPWCTDHTWEIEGFFSQLLVDQQQKKSCRSTANGEFTLLTSALEAFSCREALMRKGREVAARVSLSGSSRAHLRLNLVSGLIRLIFLARLIFQVWQGTCFFLTKSQSAWTLQGQPWSLERGEVMKDGEHFPAKLLAAPGIRLDAKCS